MIEDELNKEFVSKLEKKIKKIKKQKRRIKILIVLIALVIVCFICVILINRNTTKKISNGDIEFIYDYPDTNYSFTGVSDNFGFKTGKINYSVQNGILLIADFYVREDSEINVDNIETAEVKLTYSDETLEIREKLFDSYGLDTESSSEYSREKDGDFVSWLKNEVGENWTVLHSCKDGTYSVDECIYVVDHVPYDFPGDFKIEITYCYSENECTTEEFELSELTVMEEEQNG